MTMSKSAVLPGPSSSKEQSKKNEYIRDLKSLGRPELLEILDRQNKLISSPALKHLPDKGEKVKRYKQEIEEELARRNKAEDLCDELTKLSIKEKKIELLEWDKKQDITTNKIVSDENESINYMLDEKDPLAIIATHSGTTYNQRKVHVEEPEKPLITLADIEDAYALSLCNKIDKTSAKERFLPHKTLNKTIASTKKRDLSAATPPNPVFGDIKLITLEESLKLQYEQTQHLKEVQLKHATERLKNLRGYVIGNTLPEGNSIRSYRQQNDIYNEDESEEEKDDEDEN